MIDSLLILIIVSITCSLLGIFLILKNMSMVIDAISHSVLLGIVLGFLITNDLNSPVLIIGASLVGVVTVILIEMLGKYKISDHDDAIGIVYPILFSIAVIIISKFFKNVHLDTDIVLVGEIIFASMIKVNILGFEISRTLLTSIIMLIIVLLFIIVFFDKLKIATFDPEFAKLIGIPVGALFYGVMILVSSTAVISFNSVGSILVISFFITPAATALLISKDLKMTMIYSAIISIINCVLSFALALLFNVSISGMTAFLATLIYLAVLLYNKRVYNNKRELKNERYIYKSK